MRKQADTPAVVLCNPKYEHNIGAAIRACSCWGVKQMFWTGHRIDIDPDRKERIPREERMKGYKDVAWGQSDKPFDLFAPNIVPVAIELKPGAMSLTDFIHPENAVYVFGPEDGSVPQVIARFCHYFVFAPTHHCMNLAAAVNLILGHRRMSRQQAGLEPRLPMDQVLHETRGYIDTPVLAEMGWDGK
jgi:tRNA(Leu) C34 or U34 (ribose-2'-O)-methylase TrmL